VEQQRLESFLKTAEILQINGLTDGLKDPGGGSGENSDSAKFSEPDLATGANLAARATLAKAFEEGPAKRGRKSLDQSSSPEKRPKLNVPSAALAAVVQQHKQQLSSTGSEHSEDHDDMVIDDDYHDTQEEDHHPRSGGRSSRSAGDDAVPHPPHSLEDIKENYDEGEYVDDGEEPDEDDGEDEEYILLAGDAVTSAAAGGGILTAGPGGEKEDLGPLHKRCPVCHMIMLKKNLSRHVRDQHTTERPRSICPVCKKTYKTADWLKDHIRRGHGYSKDATDEVMAKVKAEQEGGGGNLGSQESAAVSPPRVQQV